MEYQGTGIVTETFRRACVASVCINGVTSSHYLQRWIFQNREKERRWNLKSELGKGMKLNLSYKINFQGLPCILAVWVGDKPGFSASSNSDGVASNVAADGVKTNLSAAPTQRAKGKPNASENSQMSTEKFTEFNKTGRKITRKLGGEMPVRRPVFFERRRDASPEKGRRNKTSADIVMPKAVHAKKRAAVKIRVLEKRKLGKAARKVKGEQVEKAAVIGVQKPAQIPVGKYWPVLTAKNVRKNIYQKRVAADKVYADREYKGGRKAVPRYVLTKNYGTAALRKGCRNRRVSKGALKREIAQGFWRVGVRPIDKCTDAKPQDKGKPVSGSIRRKTTLGEFLDNVTNASGTVRLKVPAPTIKPTEPKKAKKSEPKKAKKPEPKKAKKSKPKKAKKSTKSKAKKAKPSTAAGKSVLPKCPPPESRKLKQPGTAKKKLPLKQLQKKAVRS